MSTAWKEVQDENNQTYYWNTTTNETTWTLPLTLANIQSSTGTGSTISNTSTLSVYEDVSESLYDSLGKPDGLPENLYHSFDESSEEVIYNLPPSEHLPPLLGDELDVGTSTFVTTENYIVTVITGDKMFAGTSRNLNMVLSDSGGHVLAPITIINKNSSLFKRNTSCEEEITIKYRKPKKKHKMNTFKEG